MNSDDAIGTVGSTDNSCAVPLARAPQRLRLHHLFAVTAVMAVLLALSGAQRANRFELPTGIEFASSALGVVHTLVSSVAITIVLYGLAWRRKGCQFFDQPGHWLLVEITVLQLMYALIALIMRAWPIGESRGDAEVDLGRALLQLAIFPALAIVMVILNVYLGRTKCSDVYWSRVFYAKATTIVPVIGHLVVLVFLDRAVRADRRQLGGLKNAAGRPGFVAPIVSALRPGRTRDPAHWCGVVAQFTLCGVMFVTLVMGLVWGYVSYLAR